MLEHRVLTNLKIKIIYALILLICKLYNVLFNLYRGAVVPGARFDPFGPPDLDRSGNPRAGGGGRAG